MMKFFKTSLRALLFGAVLVLCPMVCNAADGDKFKLVKSVSELNDGDKIIVAKTNFSLTELGVDGTCNAALSTDYKKDTNIKACEIDVSGDVATITDQTEVLEVEREDQIFYLKAISKGLYLYTNRTDPRYNKVTYTTRTKAKTHIEITDAYDAIIWYDRQNRTAGESRLAYSGEWNKWGKFQCYDLEEYLNNKDFSIKIFKQITDQVSLSESTDNAAVISSNNGKTVDVSLSRTLVADKWNTFCVPFTISEDVIAEKFGAGTQVRTFGSMNGNVMNFAAATTIEAGKPYIVKPTKTVVDPIFTGVNIVESDPVQLGENGFYMQGTYGAKTDLTTDGTNLFLGDGNKFYKPAAGSTKMKGMRAFFIVPQGTNLAALRANIDGATTAIDELTTVVEQPTDNRIYNLQGQFVGTSFEGLHGVYVQNGKKVLVK